MVLGVGIAKNAGRITGYVKPGSNKKIFIELED